MEKKLVKMERKLQKPHLTDYNLLITQDLWQAHYPILLIILLKEFMKLNVNICMIMKNLKWVELNYLIHTHFLTMVSVKFILLLQKGVYLYEYMNDWKRFNETSLSEKEGCYSHLNMENFTDADCAEAKIVFKDFKIINLGEYYDLYDTLLLPDILKSFPNMSLERYELDPTIFCPTQRLAWQAVLKKVQIKIRSINYVIKRRKRYRRQNMSCCSLICKS